MRDDSPYREPTSDTERPPQRHHEEPCDACASFQDCQVINHFGHDAVLCAPCRKLYTED